MAPDSQPGTSASAPARVLGTARRWAAATRLLQRLPMVAGLVAAGFGVGVLETYAFGLQPLLPLAPFLPPTQPLTGVMFLLGGIALLGLQGSLPWFRILGAAVVTLLAGLIIGEYLFWTDLGIDRVLFPDEVVRLARLFPGRPDPVIASAFLCIGAALLLWGIRRAEPVVAAASMGAVVMPLVLIVGHIFGLAELYATTPRTGTALHTALALFLLGLGTGAGTQRAAVADLLRRRDAGTILLRRLLPLAVVVPLVFALVSIWGVRLGLYQVDVGIALYVIALLSVCLAIAFWAASILRRAEYDVRSTEQARADIALRDGLLQNERAVSSALRESEGRTHELLAILSHAPVMARALDGRIRWWSNGAERLYGWSAQEATGALVAELLATDLPVPAREAAAILTDKGEWEGEVTRKARDGSTVLVATHWILHRDSEGRPEAVIEVDRDVTEQHRAEAARRAGEARYRALVAASAQIVWTATPDGGRAGDPAQWSAFTGQSEAECGGRGWLDAVHPEDRPAVERAWTEAVRQRRMLVTRHRLRRQDGEFRHMDVRAVPVHDERGRVREWVGAHVDVTDQVLQEEQLRQAQKLQAVGTLAGGVAHEVNNQLMAVLGFGDFALKELGPEHPQAFDVREMVRAATRAAQVAQQLLTFSRRQAKQTQVIDLHAAAAALVPVLQRLLGADKTLELAPSGARRLVLADATQVDQVLINLIANARDAMGTGGRVAIEVDDIVLDEGYARAHGNIDLAAGAYVRISVTDDGSGMDRATLAKIFEPFFTTKPVGKGTGLGLSTVYGIVKQHEGAIWAYSEPGLGTTVKVYFPAASEADLAGVARPEESALGGVGLALAGARVLVVEDEPAVRSLARRSLEAVGVAVFEAENGREALELLAREQALPQLVLTDVIMPGLNGRELAEAIAVRHPGLPVLFMSAYAEDDLTRSLLPEQSTYIQKPFAPDTLVAQVRAALAGVMPGAV
jgi:PAS domain S-box-containing protein